MMTQLLVTEREWQATVTQARPDARVGWSITLTTAAVASAGFPDLVLATRPHC